jgi:2-haloacid dehalogenase
MVTDVFVFDAYGTLFDVHAAVARHVGTIGAEKGRILSETWRQKQLEYAWVRALAGRYRDFAALTEEALDWALARVAPEHSRLKPALLEAYRKLDAYPEVRGVLSRLKAAGARIAILSNGTPDMVGSAVQSAEIVDLVDTIISVDALATYKTDPRVYALAVRELGVPPTAISFQSSNRWDVAGAVAFGLRTIWINRSGQPDEYRDLQPYAVYPTLEGLLDLV